MSSETRSLNGSRKLFSNLTSSTPRFSSQELRAYELRLRLRNCISQEVTSPKSSFESKTWWNPCSYSCSHCAIALFPSLLRMGLLKRGTWWERKGKNEVECLPTKAPPASFKQRRDHIASAPNPESFQKQIKRPLEQSPLKMVQVTRNKALGVPSQRNLRGQRSQCSEAECVELHLDLPEGFKIAKETALPNRTPTRVSFTPLQTQVPKVPQVKPLQQPANGSRLATQGHHNYDHMSHIAAAIAAVSLSRAVDENEVKPCSQAKLVEKERQGVSASGGLPGPPIAAPPERRGMPASSMLEAFHAQFSIAPPWAGSHSSGSVQTTVVASSVGEVAPPAPSPAGSEVVCVSYEDVTSCSLSLDSDQEAGENGDWRVSQRAAMYDSDTDESVEEQEADSDSNASHKHGSSSPEWGAWRADWTPRQSVDPRNEGEEESDSEKETCGSLRGDSAQNGYEFNGKTLAAGEAAGTPLANEKMEVSGPRNGVNGEVQVRTVHRAGCLASVPVPQHEVATSPVSPVGPTGSKSGSEGGAFGSPLSVLRSSADASPDSAAAGPAEQEGEEEGAVEGEAGLLRKRGGLKEQWLEGRREMARAATVAPDLRTAMHKVDEAAFGGPAPRPEAESTASLQTPAQHTTKMQQQEEKVRRKWEPPTAREPHGKLDDSFPGFETFLPPPPHPRPISPARQHQPQQQQQQQQPGGVGEEQPSLIPRLTTVRHPSHTVPTYFPTAALASRPSTPPRLLSRLSERSNPVTRPFLSGKPSRQPSPLRSSPREVAAPPSGRGGGADRGGAPGLTQAGVRSWKQGGAARQMSPPPSPSPTRGALTGRASNCTQGKKAGGPLVEKASLYNNVLKISPKSTTGGLTRGESGSHRPKITVSEKGLKRGVGDGTKGTVTKARDLREVTPPPLRNASRTTPSPSRTTLQTRRSLNAT